MLKKILDFIFNNTPSLDKRFFKYSDDRRLKQSLLKLSRLGLKVDNVFDIGARTGDWADVIQKILSKSRFTLFEATEKCIPKLKQKGFKYYITVLSSEEKTVLFYEKGGAGDSYYQENTAHYNTIKPIEKQTTTLDNLINKEKLPLPDFLKLDTQGSEIDILKGASNALQNVKLIYVESPMIEYNKGAPKLQDYIDFMYQNDFLPYEICEQHFSHGVLVQIDILFIKRQVYQDLFGIKEKINYAG